MSYSTQFAPHGSEGRFTSVPANEAFTQCQLDKLILEAVAFKGNREKDALDLASASFFCQLRPNVFRESMAQSDPCVSVLAKVPAEVCQGEKWRHEICHYSYAVDLQRGELRCGFANKPLALDQIEAIKEVVRTHWRSADSDALDRIERGMSFAAERMFKPSPALRVARSAFGWLARLFHDTGAAR